MGVIERAFRPDSGIRRLRQWPTLRALVEFAELHVTGALAAWDEGVRGPVGAHKWVTRDCILAECLIADPSSGVRPAQPFFVVAGDVDLPERLERRALISRADMGRALHPIERAYDELKAAVRGSGAIDIHH